MRVVYIRVIHSAVNVLIQENVHTRDTNFSNICNSVMVRLYLKFCKSEERKKRWSVSNQSSFQ